MPFPTRYLILAAVALGSVSLAAQTRSVDDGSGVSVRLEPHEGKTEFHMDDAIFVDLVFTGGGAGYQVDTDSSPAQAIGDQIYVSPVEGWVRTNQTLIGKSINGNATVPLASETVRVPVLLNRVILFQKPGDYDVSIATQRLVRDFRRVETYEDCDPCPGTNMLRIHVTERPESEEGALVASLSDVLETTRELSNEEMKKEVVREDERLDQMPDSPEKEAERKRWLEKLSKMMEERDHKYELQQAARRLAAERLAYLTGDDAVRAKVHFIAEANGGDGDLAAFIMIDGLPASRNKQLQLDLLQALWRDPNHVPNDEVHSALRDARLLMHDSMLKDSGWGLTAAERKADREQYTADLDLIVATLPSRSESNLAMTIEFLKQTGVPNRFKPAAKDPGN